MYRYNPSDMESLAMSGDASELFASLEQSMEVSVLGMHRTVVEEAENEGKGQEGRVKWSGVDGAASLTQLTSMIGAQGSGLWACALALHSDPSEGLYMLNPVVQVEVS